MSSSVNAPRVRVREVRLSERDVRPAADIVRDMSAQAARILQEMAAGYLVPAAEPVG